MHVTLITVYITFEIYRYNKLKLSTCFWLSRLDCHMQYFPAKYKNSSPKYVDFREEFS